MAVQPLIARLLMAFHFGAAGKRCPSRLNFSSIDVAAGLVDLERIYAASISLRTEGFELLKVYLEEPAKKVKF
ncbi:hypothetical protein D3C77_579680 [compost metagenome]